jgi:hypothetical protein
MEGREFLVEERVVQAEVETGENTEERRFQVGELVEYWEGTLVRGYRTDSGDPAGSRQIMGVGVWCEDGDQYKREVKEGAME